MMAYRDLLPGSLWLGSSPEWYRANIIVSIDAPGSPEAHVTGLLLRVDRDARVSLVAFGGPSEQPVEGIVAGALR